jgi:predicted acyltransferase
MASVDAYRGLVMFLMLAEALSSCQVSATVADSRIWRLICHQQTHAAWVGCSLHDLIQPGFYFLVGIAVVLSLGSRQAIGQTPRVTARHTCVRSVLLVVLGMTMLAIHPRQWTWSFIDTLTQIGLAYPVLVVIAWRPKWQWYTGLIAILAGYWLLFALWPLPSQLGQSVVSSDWLNAHGLTGFGAHWQKNNNVAWKFDCWFLNLFPRDTVHTGYETGLTTLNFIPSIGTMVFGLLAGDLLQSRRQSGEKLRWLCVRGAMLIGSGWMLNVLGVCPVVKALWTPSWVLFSGGCCMLFLAAFYAVVDVGGGRRLAFPLIVIGMNSIVAYSMSHFYPALAFNSLRILLGDRVFGALGNAYEPAVYGGAVLVMYWSILYLLYRCRIFVRI